ncbi:MAG: NAD(P)-dependent oxidoreductase [Pseudomonadota bacterium]
MERHEMAKVSFLGLGTMGYPMAGHLANAGHDVTVFNRTFAKAQAWTDEYNGRAAQTPAEAAKDAEIVFACVGNDDDLREICVGENGAFQDMADGAIFVDHTTVSASVTEELATAARDIGLHFIDAPISGGQAGAENAVLSIMCGGDQDIFDQAYPVMEVYSKICKRIGDTGAGQKTKMCNQIAIAGLVQALSEALRFAQKSGLDGDKVVEVISQGAAGSWQMSNRSETMLRDEFDFGFAVDWMRKDLGICLKAAAENGADLPVTKLVNAYYADVQKMGGGRWDTSSLIKRLT